MRAYSSHKGIIKLVNKVDSVGLVPTMGSLHEGHLSLIRRALSENEKVIVSIYVNPLQFNNSDDLKKYPRDIKNDLQKLEAFSDILTYVPNDDEIYEKDEKKKKYNFGQFTEIMEGKMRPGHFNGVATVVEKLLRMFKPTNAYFGEKDFQQQALVKEMCAAFFIETEIIRCETIRDSMGLPLSSRHQRLSSSQLQLAQQFAQCFHHTADLSMLRKQLSEMGIQIEYIEDFEQRRHAAVFIGGVRLIDSREMPFP